MPIDIQKSREVIALAEDYPETIRLNALDPETGWPAALKEIAELREALAAKDQELKESHESHDEYAQQLSDSLNQAWRERDEWKARAEWLINTLNEMYSNCTRDIFGWASNEEEDISVKAIDAAIAAEKMGTKGGME